MQTFLPYADFKRCAECLDDKRLYKQIVECKQIIKAIENRKAGIKAGRVNHPVVIMWQDYPVALEVYQKNMILVWIKRRFGYDCAFSPINYLIPRWLGNEELHKSHRLNLLYKNPEHYSKYFAEEVPKEKPNYVWQ